nr:mucin-5AC-like [Dermacentor andersoni]
MRGQAATLLMLVFVASHASGRPADTGGTSAAKNDHTAREETLARLLREELRTLEGSSFPMSGIRRDASAVSAIVSSDDGDLAGSSTHVDGPRDASVDLAAVPESTGNNRVSSHQHYEVGRSLGSKDSTPSEEAILQQRPPPYRESDHLAEKRALPPHVVRARSSGDGFLMKLRSRSRPVYKPLYSSSEHLAARPAIPLPQIEAYLSSKAAESIAVGAPSLLDEAKEDVAVPAVTQAEALQGLSTVLPPRYSSTKVPFQTPTVFPFVPKTTVAPKVPELVPEPLPEKPVLLHAVEELVGQESILQSSSKAPPVPSASTTEAPSVSYDTTATEVVPSTTEGSKAAVTLENTAAVPSVDERPPLPPKQQTVKAATTAPSVSFPTNLYLPDALVLSNQHSKPQHSRFSPATVPSRRTATTTYSDEHRTSAMVPSTRAPPPFPPRRRMTFQPFRKTTAVPVHSSVSTDATPQWQKESPLPPHYAADDEFDIVRRKKPVGRPVLDTTKDHVVSTEPSINTELKFPEVPEELGEGHHVEHAQDGHPGENKVEKNEPYAPPTSVQTPLDTGSALSSADEVKTLPSNLDKPPSQVAVPHTDSAPTKPLHYGLDSEVAPASESSAGETAVLDKLSPTGPEEDSAIAKPAPELTSSQDEGSLGLPGSLSDQQSALEILEQLHKAEEAPIEEPSALADPKADADAQPSFNIDDMMVSLAMGEGDGSDGAGDEAESAPQAPAHLTDMQGRLIY